MNELQERIFCRTALLAGDKMMQRLADTRVIIFGVGGVGSWAAECLVRSGIGHLTMVDSDTVAASNINRQLPALLDTVGVPKVEVLRQRFMNINPEAEIKALQVAYTPDNADEFGLETYDYVVDAIDSLSCKAALILHADRLKLKLVSSMGAALKLDPTRISVAEFRKVQGCPLARALRNKFKRSGTMPRRKFQCVYSPELLQNRQNAACAADQSDSWAKVKASTNGTFAHATAIFGNMLAGLIIQDIYKSCE